MKSSNILHGAEDDAEDTAFEVAPHVLRGEATPPPASLKEGTLVGSATTVRDEDEKMDEGGSQSFVCGWGEGK